MKKSTAIIITTIVIILIVLLVGVIGYGIYLYIQEQSEKNENSASSSSTTTGAETSTGDASKNQTKKISTNTTSTSNQSAVKKTTSESIIDYNKYIGTWSDGNYDELQILSIANGYCTFNWGIYRVTTIDNIIVPLQNNIGSFYFQGYNDKNYNLQEDAGEHYYRKGTIYLNSESIIVKVEDIDSSSYDASQEISFGGQVYVDNLVQTFRIQK